ncbi:metallophosphoesterase family protein [Thermospira aquatica]|uniref:Metallophosphoesterase n=1 Tax=Thermospira aquatica TaxID=2828656 RepID=A0AAX3BFU0_9SPIR|nr:metallophosphoesterase [Thermospira aquatica]URA11111.1 metallophosphoesterase [Thermospira aquatica]
MKIALISDLHLSFQLPWTKTVWESFLTHVEKKGISTIVIGGDLFDSIDDAYQLRTWFASSLEKTPISRVLWIAGNHDLTNPLTTTQSYQLEDLSFGDKIEISLVPDLYLEDDLEILTYPYPKNPKEQNDAFSPVILAEKFPPPTHRRIAVGHVALSSWLNVEENDNLIIPIQFASMLSCDRVFLGHIHQHKSRDAYQTLGSARVWRKGEKDPHGYWIYDSTTDTIDFFPLKEGRTYEETEVFVFYDTLDEKNHPAVDEFTWLHITLHGVVQNDEQKEAVKKNLRASYPKACEISFDDQDLHLASALATHPLWQTFFSTWEKHYEKAPETEKTSWLLARQIFVREFLKTGGKL